VVQKLQACGGVERSRARVGRRREEPLQRVARRVGDFRQRVAGELVGGSVGARRRAAAVQEHAASRRKLVHGAEPRRRGLGRRRVPRAQQRRLGGVGALRKGDALVLSGGPFVGDSL